MVKQCSSPHSKALCCNGGHLKIIEVKNSTRDIIVGMAMGMDKYAKLLSSFGYQLLPRTTSNRASSTSDSKPLRP